MPIQFTFDLAGYRFKWFGDIALLVFKLDKSKENFVTELRLPRYPTQVQFKERYQKYINDNGVTQ